MRTIRDSGRDGDEEIRDDLAGSATERWTAGSRRLLLAGVAGGLTLTASGLLRPDWLDEEAEAGDRPLRRVQGRNGQQREMHRRQREHRREVQRRRDETQGRSRVAAPHAFKILLISERGDDGEIWGYQDSTGTWYSIKRTDRNGNAGATWPIISRLGLLVTALDITEDQKAILVQYWMLIEAGDTVSFSVGGKMTDNGFQGRCSWRPGASNRRGKA